MICSICSLLCDEVDLDRLDCAKRRQALVQLAGIRKAEIGPSKSSNMPFEMMATGARNVFITGRVASVQTARAAISLAMKLDACIDCSFDGHVFKNINAIQRSGLNSVSIAEARDKSDFIIVAGDDRLLDACPRIPDALACCEASRRPVLLVGRFTHTSREAWGRAGFDVWSIDCSVQDIPKSLAHWSRYGCSREEIGSIGDDDSDAFGALIEKMNDSQYTTILWNAENIDVEHADLWCESMLQWIAAQNEEKRCAALLWSSLDGTFQQVCTWLTGFPGRVQFRAGVPCYDPIANSLPAWLSRLTTREGQDANVVVCIDETLGSSSRTMLDIVDSAKCGWVDISPASRSYPTEVAGVETPADIFRADQVLLAHVEPTQVCESKFARSAAEWLAEMLS